MSVKSWSVSSKRIILAFNDRAKWPIYITCLFTNLYAGQYTMSQSVDSEPSSKPSAALPPAPRLAAELEDADLDAAVERPQLLAFMRECQLVALLTNARARRIGQETYLGGCPIDR